MSETANLGLPIPHTMSDQDQHDRAPCGRPLDPGERREHRRSRGVRISDWTDMALGAGFGLPAGGLGGVLASAAIAGQLGSAGPMTIAGVGAGGVAGWFVGRMRDEGRHDGFASSADINRVLGRRAMRRSARITRRYGSDAVNSAVRARCPARQFSLAPEHLRAESGAKTHWNFAGKASRASPCSDCCNLANHDPGCSALPVLSRDLRWCRQRSIRSPRRLLGLPVDTDSDLHD